MRQLLLSCALAFFLIPNFALSKPIYKQHAMVTSANKEATDAGVKILKMGGNAVDAAVATALAISVVDPFSAGIGGGGFLLLHMAKDKKTAALDFREVAPKLATTTMFADETSKRSSITGHFSVAIPGTIAGLHEVHKAYGKLPWSSLFAPAIALAENGFEVGPTFAEFFELTKGELQKNEAAWKAFTKQGKPFSPGDTLKQPDLAKTLTLLSRDPRAFYEGSIAKAIAGDMSRHRGLLSEADLKSYKPKWRDPLCGEFMGTEICSMPPPSSGGILLLQMLNAVTEIGPDNLPWRTPETIHTLVQIMKASFKDRAEILGDPDFVKIPLKKLISREYARKVVGKITTLPLESQDTTHLNVVDSERNVVSLTFTVNLPFGARVVVPGTGILLNDEMDDFSSAPNVPNAFGLVGGTANAIAPGKIPLSSMTPVIAFKNKKFLFAVGSPGGSRIITTVFHTILNHMIYAMNPQEALSSGRFHHQWAPNEIWVEKNTLDPATISDLNKLGHKVSLKDKWSNANMIAVSPAGGLDGSADPRGEGTAAGY